MPIHQLSKSTILRGKQCEKSLWLYKNYPQLRDPLSKAQKALFNSGTHIGLLAQKLFPNGVDATPKKRFDYQAAINKTQEAIATGVETIYEATFLYNGVLVMLDILHKENGKWLAYEVKSAAKVSQTYIFDAAVQYFVIQNSGLKLNNIFITNINKDYIFDGQLDVQQLFKHQSVLKEVIALQDEVSDLIAKLLKTIAQKDMPDIAVGNHCFSPYPCDFIGTCWKNKTNESKPENQKTEIKKEAITTFRQKINYPLALLDIEVFMPAIPLFVGTHPYQHIPFAFVLKKIQKPDTQPKTQTFIAAPGINPEKEFAKNLADALSDCKTIMAFDSQLESQVLNISISVLPEAGDIFNNALKNILDISLLFKKQYISIPEIGEKSSLKIIAEAIGKDNKYENLQILDGRSAQAAYESLQHSNNMFEIDETLQNILNYCAADVEELYNIYDFVQDI